MCKGVPARTTQIPGRSKFFYGKISDVLNTKIGTTFEMNYFLTFFAKFSQIYLTR